MALKPFRVGEYISVTGVEGTVESIDIFYTRVSTTDNKTIVIPNGTITGATITNVTNADKRMLVLDFMVPYEADISELKGILKDIMRQEEMIFQEEPMDVVINKLSPLKVQMQLKAWVKTEDFWEVRYRLLEQIKCVLEQKYVQG